MAKKKAIAKANPNIDEVLDKKYRYALGIDPSLDGTGLSVLDFRFKEPKLVESIVVKGRNKTWGETPHQVKLALTQAKVKELVAKYSPLFPIIFMERGFTRFNNDTQATFRVRGAIESELVGFEIVEYTPSAVKLTATGKGDAEKEEVRDSMCEFFGVGQDFFETLDCSDSAAVVYKGYKEYLEN